MKSKLYNHRIRSEIYDRLLVLYPYDNINFTEGINELVFFGYMRTKLNDITKRIEYESN